VCVVVATALFRYESYHMNMRYSEYIVVNMFNAWVVYGRFGRVLSGKGLHQLQRYFHRWEQCVRKTVSSLTTSMENAKLRSELCNLKAMLHELTDRDEVVAGLAAEKALNR